MSKADMVFAHNSRISDDEIAEVRKMINVPLRLSQWNVEANLDNIRHFSHGLGDDNPLFCDEEYGKRSIHGSVIAPGCFLYAIWAAGVNVGFPGLQAFYGGCRWEWKRPVKPGDRIDVEAKMTDLKDIQGRRAGRFLMQIGHASYRDGEGVEIATNVSRAFRMPRAGVDSESGLKYGPRNKVWSEAELDEIDAEVVAQTRQGDKPLYWEDVIVGSSIPSRLKGPLDLASILTYYAGNLSSLYMSTDMAAKRRHLARTAPETLPNNRPVELVAERIPFGLGHTDGKVAQAVGMPGAYDNGYQRVGWAQQLMTDWIGDHGFLKMLDVTLHLPNIIGDVIRYTGKVVDKRVEGDEHLVDVEITVLRDDGELSCKGQSTVRLPSRSASAANVN